MAYTIRDLYTNTLDDIEMWNYPTAGGVPPADWDRGLVNWRIGEFPADRCKVANAAIANSSPYHYWANRQQPAAHCPYCRSAWQKSEFRNACVQCGAPGV